jgi:PAS domain S-box-containing protein
MTFDNPDFGLFRYFPEPAFVIDPDGKIFDSNDAFASRFSASTTDIRGRNVYELLASFHHAPDIAVNRKAKANEVLRSGSHLFFDDEKDGKHWRHFVHPVRNPDGEITRLLVIVHDITKAKEEERRSRKENVVFKALMDATPGSVIILDARGRMVGFNRFTMEAFGKSEEELYECDPFEIIHPEDRNSIREKFRAILKFSIDEVAEARICMNSDPHRPKWFMINARKTEIDGESFVVTVGLDIDERKQMEVELKRSHDRLDFTLEKSHLGWWEFDPVNNTTIRTLEHDRIFGYSDMLPVWHFSMFLEHVIDDDRANVNNLCYQALEHHDDFTFECRIRRKDGEIRWIWVAGGFQFDTRTRHYLISGIVRDINERKQQEARQKELQLEMQQAQKMEIVGQLAGGIAHDFNNALTAILGNADLLGSKMPPSFPFLDNIEVIRKAAMRSANMTRQLLAFARKQMIMPKVCILDEEIKNLLPMISSLIGTRISFVWRPMSGKASICIDPSQLDQILINLCINARDAIADTGSITIETGVVSIDADKSPACLPCQLPGYSYARIIVSDTGCGIDTMTLPHIFEPFFTTKAPGQGTGLGLSTVYGILMQNNGCIECQSHPQSGTTFIVCLPLHADNAERKDAELQETTSLPLYKTILLVEDAPDILAILKEVLEEKGFNVLATLNANAAIELARKHQGIIDLLITDIMLPDLNGIRLSEQLLLSTPGMKTLFMSGYAHDSREPDSLRNNHPGEERNFIQKPFSIDSFMTKVSRTLHPDVSD